MSEPVLEDVSLFLKRLYGRLLDHGRFAESLEVLRKRGSVSFDGVYGSSCALSAAAIGSRTDFPLLVVVPHPEDIDRICDDLALFTDAEILPFQPREADLARSVESSEENREPDSPSSLRIADDIFGQRIRVLKRLVSDASKPAVPSSGNSNYIIVTGISALVQPVPNRDLLLNRTRNIAVGKRMNPLELVKWLVEGGYHNTPGVDLPGEFAVRGSLLDLFAPDWDIPVRIEFFDDEIESIRRFDIATQRSRESIDSTDITHLRADLAYDGFLSDYLPPESTVFLLEPGELEQSGRTYLERLANPPHLHQVSEVLKRLLKFPCVSAANLAQGFEETHCPLPVQTVERLHGDLTSVKTELDAIPDDEIIIVCPTEAEAKRLGETFADTIPLKENRLHFTTGRLSGGFRMIREKLILIGSGQLFERHDIRRTRRRHLGQVIDSFLELKPGDLIVHVSHGIGRFRGLLTLTKSQQEEEHLQLEFAEGAILYVPVSKISLVQKYVAGSKSKPKLAKLGGNLWTRHKKAVQEAVFDMAVEMIDLQAERETKAGISFPDDSDWQTEFDAAFPYRETDDQLDAIEAIKNDMRASGPMDRLICGDVGFGKTEVAMRAVFKAVDAGYQAAVLVPTTILAEQHYRTFVERMAEFPFKIAALSRFQSPKEQRKIVEDLLLGKIDIVIGTQRIVSKDIAFHNLGLVVIDEEQRFGVAHKERLKTLRSTIDVLTLTATPIPRTLHMSLLGIRDISNLETPPEDRLAVETRLVRYNPELIRSAMMRELARGGQAFFVHNRVMDIEDVAEKLRRIVPEARIGIGHAQMPEDELERVMREFVQHEFDVLVCTTIIESGLDIPNANTMFIDRADRYGLADLHQLRGRVGRYKHQAYCYLLIDANQPMTPDATKRLRAIEEFSHLGAGFNLAMRDLEIRGAGNILGTQQSGHIAVVGYEMYCQFLDAAVRTLKRLPPKTVIDVEIDLPGVTLIPKTYVPNQRMKIDLYRRLSRVATYGDLQDLSNEIIDRFGKPPKEVKRLLALAKLRIDAHRWRIRSIKIEQKMLGDNSLDSGGGYLVLEYVSQTLIAELQKKSQHPIRITPDMFAYVPLPFAARSPDDILYFAGKILTQNQVN